MKHFITDNIILVLFALLAAAGCTREELAPAPAGDFVAPSEFEIGWEYGDVVNIDTRTEQSVTVENRVTNLYVLLAADGKIIHRKSYWVTRDSQIPDGYDNIITAYSEKVSADGEASRGTIPAFFTGAGNSVDFDMLPYRNSAPFTFYAVANYSDAVGQELDRVSNAAGLEELSSRFTTEGNVNRTRFLMTAKESGISLNIDDEGRIERVGVNLDLKRVDAKIKFNVTVDIEDAVEGTVLFDNMTYRVHRVPDVTFLFPKEKGQGDGQEWDAAAIAEAQSPDSGYSCMLDDNYQTFDTTRVDGGTFAFYLRENRPNPKKRITPEEQGDWSTLYAMREAWPGGEENPVDDVSNRVPVHGRQFTYAPENATFVEISGDLSYTRTTAGRESEEVFGSVTYIVHLGETGNAPNDEEAVNNYDVRRNVSYIYNMRITGINNFVVEVTEGEERRPGAEGDITVSSTRQVTMDAHYGRVLLELDKTSIEQGASWSVRTPIGEVRYDTVTGLINSPYDYKWVLFAVNADFGVGSDRMVKFPGVQAYDGGVQFFEDMNADELKEAIANDRGNYSYLGTTYTTYTFKDYIESHDRDNYWYGHKSDLTDYACLLDVNQLVHYLEWSLRHNPDIFGEDDKVAVTAFCDEYTYIYDPQIEDYIHPGQSVANMGDKDRRLLLWKNYVDADSRVMNITPMATTEYSPDGNTSLTNSYITISQNSIKSIYNPDRTDTAWGLETTNETGKLTHETQIIAGSYGPIHNNNGNEIGDRTNTLNDGRTNFLNFWVGTDRYGSTIHWTDAMNVNRDVENGNDLNEDYRNAFYACITRNRDLNGNNLIDADEIYWYLAARDQLTGLWIGQGALDDEAWMYNGDGTEINHLITSSHRNNADGNLYWVLWAEEGASLGGLRVGGDEHTNNGYDYLCVRNLGIDIAEEEAPQHFAEISNRIDNGDQDYYTIDASIINSRALRTSPDEGINLPFDHERSQNNTPFRSFDVRTANGDSISWLRMRDNINDNGNPCPEGWRVPNQREMLIIMSFDGQNGFSLGDSPVATATSFSFCGTGSYDDDRYGFYFSPPNIRLSDGDASVRLRCVRDTPSAY